MLKRVGSRQSQIYNQTIAALNTLTKKDLNEMRSLPTPPKGCILTMEVICIML